MSEFLIIVQVLVSGYVTNFIDHFSMVHICATSGGRSARPCDETDPPLAPTPLNTFNDFGTGVEHGRELSW